MAKIALTNIKHGNDDGTVVEIEAGQPVKGLDKATMERLEELGSIGSPAQSPAAAEEQINDLQTQVAELQAKLAELQGPPAPAVGPLVPGKTLPDGEDAAKAAAAGGKK